MEHSEPSIYKSLIDYSELQRLKHIEEQYNELKKTTANCRCHNSSVESESSANFPKQIGQGSESAPFVFSDVSAISQPKSTLEQPYLEAIEPSQPSVASLSYDVQIVKSDDHSIYDDRNLLSHIPKTHQKAAQALLRQIDLRGNELTFNSSGNIFIDQVAIPNTNIYVLFPFLFKKKRPLNLEGFDALLQKLNEMGLGSLIKSHSLPTTSQSTDTKPMNPGFSPTQVPWWYIGD